MGTLLHEYTALARACGNGSAAGSYPQRQYRQHGRWRAAQTGFSDAGGV